MDVQVSLLWIALTFVVFDMIRAHRKCSEPDDFRTLDVFNARWHEVMYMAPIFEEMFFRLALIGLPAVTFGADSTFLIVANVVQACLFAIAHPVDTKTRWGYMLPGGILLGSVFVIVMRSWENFVLGVVVAYLVVTLVHALHNYIRYRILCDKLERH